MKKDSYLPLSVPNFCGNEKEYVANAVISEWVSTGGSGVLEFEKKLCEYLNDTMSVATASGTAALHLALLCLGAGKGQEILVPTLTFVAAVNPVRYVGAEPVFFGCDDTLCIDTVAVLKFCIDDCRFDGKKLINKKTGRYVSGIIPVHVFGNLCDMEAIMYIAKKYNLFVLEDATEALGSRFLNGEFAGKAAGTIGDFGAYSFNGNKLITTGSGGALVARDKEKLCRAKYLSTQAKDDELHFVHGDIGYNYRLTNLSAALGLAQLENIEKFIAVKIENYNHYKTSLSEIFDVRLLDFRDDIRSNCWFYSLYLERDCPITRDMLLSFFSEQKIGARPIWSLIHTQTPYLGYSYYGDKSAADYRKRVVNLPCSTNLTTEDIARVCAVLVTALKRK